MRYIEVTVNTPEEEIDLRCQQMADMGAGGFVIENEADFQAFLETPTGASIVIADLLAYGICRLAGRK